MRLSKEEVLKYQQNKPPYLMIDEAEEVIPGKSAKGYKYLDPSEWFFKVHWPTDPNMPGMLQIESLVQMCALSLLTLPGNKGKLVYIISANNLVFKRKIVPNEILEIETNIISYSRGIAKCKGVGRVKGDLACSADFNIILPHEITKFKIK
jgi:3-hydroxyacyl-[acyl-carrier-protein] dehydratase